MIVDFGDIKEKQQVNVEVMPLNHFLEVHQLDQIPSQLAGVVTFFNLDEEIRNMAEVLYTFRDSYLFKVCWEKQAKHLAASEMEDDNTERCEIADIMATPEMIHEDIFQPCHVAYKNIYTSLKNNTITLEEVKLLFGDFKGKYEELAQDLDIMCRIDKSTDKQWIHSRVQQIEQYHELHLAVASAEIIMKVKRTLHLEGDFKVLETLTKVVSCHITPRNVTFISDDCL